MKKLKEFLLKNNGKPSGYTWYDVAKKFKLDFCAKEYQSESQKREAIGDRARAVWKSIKNKPSPPYDDLKLKSVWEQRTKDGNIHLLHSYTNDESNEALICGIEDVVKKSVMSLSPIKFEKNDRSNERALLIPISDMHIGAIGGSFITNNEYNKSVVEYRLSLILSEVYYLNKRWGTFDKIIIVDLGDSLDGYNKSTVRGGKELDQNLNNREQFEIYFNSFKSFFDTLITLNASNDISFYATQGNHDGAIAHMAQRALEIYLNTKYPELSTLISNDFISTISYGKHRYHMTHGKDEKYMKAGLPLTINDKTEIMFQRYLDENNYGSDLYHTIIKGDLHQHVDQRDFKFRYLSCPSFFGGTNFIHYNYDLSKPSVIYDIIPRMDRTITKGEILF
jgi:hypothetical protein